MKTLRFFGMALFAVLMCVNLASCSSDDIEPNESQKGKEVVVSLGFSGDFEISESPLSRATSNDLYIVDVIGKKNDLNILNITIRNNDYSFNLGNFYTELPYLVSEEAMFNLIKNLVDNNLERRIS